MTTRFVAASLAALVSGRFFYRNGHLPPSGHLVPEGFIGLGVAAAKDPAVDHWIIEKLRVAGIRDVRIDLSPGDVGQPPERLLCRLLDADFRVVLHLLQSTEQAKQMPAAAVADLWRAFVADVLDRFGGRVRMVEVGSTINRRRWAGYSLSGFAAAWEIAWREVRARDLVLAGPSITDFEPLWTVGVLSFLQRRRQLPDVHTDNLFAERATEPERFDPKILGRRLAGLHRFNLIKKARLLQRLGADHGVPRLFSPAAFWTLPRIERMLPDSEQKQADYLTRYLVLCAASGALEGAWWGPLICHREGLIDDGKRPYPELERITHYADVSGSLAELRVRPAFAALASAARFLQGSRYLGRVATGEGLEIHAFSSTSGLVHALWTINGRAAALADLYTAHDLAGARFIGRDGNDLAEVPTLAGESPCYLCWPEGGVVKVNPGAALLADVAIHRHGAGEHHFFRADGWRGMVRAADAAEAALLWQAIHPARLAPPARQTTLRHARNAIWTIDDPRTPGYKLVVKQPVRIALHKRLLDRFKPSKALRSWNGSSELLRRGVDAAPPVAWFEREDDRGLTQNYYVCEYVPAEFTVREMAVAHAAGETHFAGVDMATAHAALAAFIARMHGGGLLFRDLSGGNLLLRPDAEAGLRFTLIDTGRIRVYPGPLPLRRRIDDLVRVCNKMHALGRESFLAAYLERAGYRCPWWLRLPFLLYDLKVGLKRRIGRKAWKRLLRRK
ncbi:hypothetical protein [Azonexus fungiphilus]|uniref:hypothetical protein n=1 Tax=Azonexus fungiphilus TaxID=146940 RepID=UPI00156B352D|nr:hypothetical protein [Azonexus fungiphilus]NHC06300.1 hypothetical protein [Azonexus fungiphilus]